MKRQKQSQEAHSLVIAPATNSKQHTVSAEEMLEGGYETRLLTRKSKLTICSWEISVWKTWGHAMRSVRLNELMICGTEREPSQSGVLSLSFLSYLDVGSNGASCSSEYG